MMSGKCGCMKLCPVSFGLALGLSCGIGVFIWSLWVLYYGASPMMAAYHVPTTVVEGLTCSLWCLLKGFIFGFFIALFYDLLVCCGCHKWCCKKSDGASSCCDGQKDKK